MGNLPDAVRLHASIARAIAQYQEEAKVCLDRQLDNVEAFTRATLDLDRGR